MQCQSVLSLVTALVVASTIGGLAHAREPLASISTSPTTVELCPNDQATPVLVTLRNNDANPIRNICLRAFTNSPITLKALDMIAPQAHNETPANTGTSEQNNCSGGISLPELRSGATISKLLSFNVANPSPSSPVTLWADYQMGDPSKGENETATGSFTVTTRKLSVDSFKVQAQTNFLSLYDRQEGSVLLTITNGTNDSLKVSTSMRLNPPSTQVEPAKTMSTTVAPQDVMVIPYKIKVGDSVTPGKYFGLIQVDAETDCGTVIHRAVSYEVTLGVFGESQVLTAIKVPSLLLLPGFLILTLWMLLWRFKIFSWRVSFLAKPTNADEFIIGGTDSEFWLLGITFSLLLFFALPSVMAVGYEEPYNLGNIAKLWAASLVISFIIYVVLLFIDRRRAQQAAEKSARLTLTKNDDVLTVVEKMQARSWPKENCRPVKSTASVTPAIDGFTLWEEKPGETVWVIPQIECVASPGNLGDLDPGRNDIDTSELLRQLKEITTKKLGLIQWGKKSGFDAPRLMQQTELDNSSGEMVVFRPL